MKSQKSKLKSQIRLNQNRKSDFPKVENRWKSDFLITVLKTIKKYSMLNKNDKVLVGFSGGPDSMALLHTLKSLGVKIHACHINHQLRDRHADRDEKFAIHICHHWNIPIVTRRIDVKKYAKEHKMSIEESARTLRYEELTKQAIKLHCTKIALGHNANDNTETVILNLTRGSGLAGLAGIPPTRNNIIRPLIEITRKEIIQYLKQHKINYCTDSTNIELGYRRNYIRHKIIPYLYKINPNLDQTILRTSEIIRTTNNDILNIVKKAIEDVIIKANKECVVLDIKKLLSYNCLIRREIIKTMLPKLEFEQVNSVLALVDKPSGTRIKLIKDLCAWREYNKLYFGQYKNNKIAGKIWKVNINRKTKISELNLELMVKASNMKSQKSKVKTQNSKLYAIFDKSAIALPLSIRFRRFGDRFIPFQGKEKKLKDIFIDDKIPARIRNQIPLLCDANNDILWIIGSRRSNIGLITSKTQNFLEAKVKKWQNNPFETLS